MADRNIVSMRLLFLGLAVLGLLCYAASSVLSWADEKSHETKVVFLDVGEGDAILISQGSDQVLIDGGRDGKALLYRIGRHVPFWDRQIETVIVTHPDADHIGGLLSLFKAYRVSQVLTTGARSDTDVSRLFEEAAERSVEGKEISIFRGATLQFPLEGELLVEYPAVPVTEKTENTNGQSLVMRFTYGETSFLLMGDLPREESALPEEQPATILKVSHHGSKYSTSDAFLDLVQPKEAVVSVGKNMYGHPAIETLERLTRRGIQIYRTDEVGDVVYSCSDGHCSRLD